MNDLIISLAFPGRENYPEIQKGLIKSIEEHWDGDAWINPDIPYTPHAEVPYKFKYDLIEAALQKGYRRIWWFDSTIRLKQNPFPLFFQTRSGIVAFNNEGHPLWKYISDQAALNMNLSESWIKEIPQCWGGATGWDFNDERCEWIFRKLEEQIRLGSFADGDSKRDGFVAARHDQSVLSGLLYLYCIDLLPYGLIAAPKDITENTYLIYGD
jgi:hypothetical protein